MNNWTKNSFSLWNILKTSFTQCYLFYLFLNSTCPLFVGKSVPVPALYSGSCSVWVHTLNWFTVLRLYILKYTSGYTAQSWYDPGYTYLKLAVTTKPYNLVFLTIVFFWLFLQPVKYAKTTLPSHLSAALLGYNLTKLKHARV